MAFDDRELLARIIECEAGGEGDNGMRAVATVVMNRVHVPNGEYQRVGQGNLRNIIHQPGQFDCVLTTIRGTPHTRNIYNMRPTSEHYRIAEWALGGGRHAAAGESLWFMNPWRPDCPLNFPNQSGEKHTRINEHCFFRPTALYKNT